VRFNVVECDESGFCEPSNIEPTANPINAPIGPPRTNPSPPPINLPKLPITTLFESILGLQRYEKTV
jgi:hypothetical protein